MKYCFILGSNPTLSIAEISAVFGLIEKETRFPVSEYSETGNRVSVVNNALILETNQEINAKELIKKSGGTVKIGVINYESLTANKDKLLDKIIKIMGERNKKGKFNFGISYYGEKKFNIKPLAMEIKKYLRDQKISSRWVTSREETLSSVVVEQNKLIGEKGIEIILIEPPLTSRLAFAPAKRAGEAGLYQGGILIGRTLAVQPFKELSFRDYGRPARDDYSGMLPPKLAQIMINLAGVGVETRRGASLLDPFCGSGTILTEAMLMGFKNIIGSDISAKAVEDTKKNMEWIIKNYELRITNYELFNKSILELSEFVKPNSVDAIITEPYLGPQRGKVDFNKTKRELENLYSKSLIEFKKVLKSDGRVVMVWPIFHETHNMEYITLDFNLSDFKIINPIPENLRKNKFIKLTNRNTIIYGREGQKIWREIIILKKAMPF